MVPRKLILQRSDGIEVKPKRGEGSLHPRPKGQGIRDPPHSRSNKNRKTPSVDTFMNLKSISTLTVRVVFTSSQKPLRSLWLSFCSEPVFPPRLLIFLPYVKSI